MRTGTASLRRVFVLRLLLANLAVLLIIGAALHADDKDKGATETIPLPGLHQHVEILIDHWEMQVVRFTAALLREDSRRAAARE